MADRFDLDPDTLRYYEREGVLPAPARDGGGRRVYTAGDIELIEMLVHLKATGMPLAQIAEFTGLAASRAGGSEQVALLQRHQRAVLEQRDRLDASLDVITRKIALRPGRRRAPVPRQTGLPNRLRGSGLRAAVVPCRCAGRPIRLRRAR